jgi:hypothetical protein
MATATAKPLSDNVSPPKRGPGRPQGSGKYADPGTRIPPPPNPKPSPEIFFDYWKRINAEFPDRPTAHLYRIRPRIDRERLNKPKFIESGSYFSQDQLLERWGEGDYQIILNDPYRPKSEGQKLAECIVKLRDPNRPAIIEDLRELVLTDPDNAEYIAKLRLAGIKLPGDEMLPGELKQALADLKRPDDGSVQRSLDLVQAGAQRSQEILMQTFAGILANVADPAKQFEQMEKLLTLLRPQQQQPAGLDIAAMMTLMQTMVKTMIDPLAASIERLSRAQTSAPAPPPAPPADPLMDALKTRLLERVIDQMENPQAPDTPAWVPLVGKGIETLSTFAAAFMAQSAAAPAGRATRIHVRPNQPGPASPAPGAPAPTSVGDNQPMPVRIQPTQPQAQTATPANADQKIVEHIREQLRETIAEGGSALDFRDLVIEEHGRRAWATVRMMPSVKLRILAALRTDPEFGPMVQADPQTWDKFVEEFLSDAPNEEDSSEEEQPAAPQASDRAPQ